MIDFTTQESSHDWVARMAKRQSPLSDDQVASRREAFLEEQAEQPLDGAPITSTHEDDLYITGRITIAEYQQLIKMKLGETRDQKSILADGGAK